MTSPAGRPRLLQEELVGLVRSCERLARHHRDLAALMPVAADALERLSEDELTRVEALLKKVEQTVDGLRPVFRLLLDLLGEPARALPQARVLDRLETLGAIESAEGFKAMAELRNALTHEYPSQPALQAAMISAAWKAVPALIEVVAGVRRFAIHQRLVEAGDVPEPQPA